MSSTCNRLRIAVDFGGVLSASSGDYEDGKNEAIVPINIEDALESLLFLKKEGHELYLVSFCGKKRAEQTRSYLETTYPDIFTELYFVKSTKFKSAICSYIKADVMIDDRLDILNSINELQTHRIHFVGDPNRVSTWIDFDFTGFTAKDWIAVVVIIKALEPLNRFGTPQKVDLKKMYY